MRIATLNIFPAAYIIKATKTTITIKVETISNMEGISIPIRKIIKNGVINGTYESTDTTGASGLVITKEDKITGRTVKSDSIATYCWASCSELKIQPIAANMAA